MLEATQLVGSRMVSGVQACGPRWPPEPTHSPFPLGCWCCHLTEQHAAEVCQGLVASFCIATILLGALGIVIQASSWDLLFTRRRGGLPSWGHLCSALCSLVERALTHRHRSSKCEPPIPQAPRTEGAWAQSSKGE